MEPPLERKPLETVPVESAPALTPTDSVAPSATDTPAASTCSTVELEKQIIAALQTCYDPEIPVNIYELGLIYTIRIEPPGAVHIRMTLTSPACPAAGSLPPEVQRKVAALPGVASVKVDVVWEPPWEQSMMSEAAQIQLGLF